MCAHTGICVSSYWHITLVYMCAIKTHTVCMCAIKHKMCAHTGISGIYVSRSRRACYICVLMLLYMLLYMCAHTTVYVCSYWYICVPKPKGLLYVCPYATLYVCSYYYICVLMLPEVLLYMCPHATN